MIRRSPIRTTKLTLLATTALFATVPAYAQDVSAPSSPTPSATPTAPAAASEDRGGLEDIIVTARRRVENLQNIPVAATVISEKQISTFQINSIEKVAAMAPQLIVSRTGSGNGASIGLRGISVNATSISLEQSVATVIDGVYYSGGRALNIGLFDLSQVELLKGPQSLFYGKNTTAGAISVTTANPTKTLTAMARVGYEFKAKQPYVEGFISGPLTDQLSFRVAGYYSNQYGYLIKNVAVPVTTYTRDIATGIVTPHTQVNPNPNTPNEKNFIARGTLKYDSGSGFTAVLKNTYNSFHTSTANSSYVIAACESGLVQSDATAPCGFAFKHVQQAIPADIAATVPVIDRHGGKPFLDFYGNNTTLTFAYETDKVNLFLTPAFTKTRTYWTGDFDMTNLYLNRASTLGTGGNAPGTREQQDAFSVEFRAQTSLGGPVNFMVGGYYQHMTLGFEQYNIFPGGAENSAAPVAFARYLTLYKLGHMKGDTYSGFGQILWDITPNLNLTGGVRYSQEKKNSSLNIPYVISTSLASFAAKTLSQPNQTFTNTSPEATLTWKPSSNITVYGSYRTGYKSGGFSISGTISPLSTSTDATYQPETVSGFEGGIKSTLFDNQLRVNFDGYWYNYKGLQVDYFDPTTIRYLTTNAAKARSRGLELETEFAPRSAPGLTLRGSAAYTDAVYTQFPFAPCLGGERPNEGCNLAPNAAGAFTLQSLTGQRTPQAPKWTASLGTDYSTPVGNNLKIGLSANLRYSSRYKTYAFAPDNASRFFQKDFAAIDASFSIARSDDRWELALIGKNLTNHFIMTSAIDNTYTGSGAGTVGGIHSDVRASVSDPRTVSLRFTAKY